MKKNKVIKILLIITIIILIMSAVIGVATSAGLINSILSSDGKTIVDGSDITILTNLMGTLGAVTIGLSSIVAGSIIVATIWLIYGFILIVTLLIKKAKNKKIIIGVVAGIILIILLLLSINYFRAKSLTKENTIGSIAYNHNQNQYIVYIKESEKYSPYIVLHNDYNHSGNTILLRKNVIDEPIVKMDDDTYKDSYVDLYLSQKFIYSFDNKLIQKINDTKLTFSKETNGIEKGYTIKRKFFILSNSEIGYSYLFGQDNAKSKTVLNYFEDDENKIAYNDENNISPWWTRTSYYYSFDAVGYNGMIMRGINSNEGCGIRPAFTIPSDTKIKKEYNENFNEEILVLDI